MQIKTKKMNKFFENIEVDNFKVFKDSKSIRLNPINILIGKITLVKNTNGVNENYKKLALDKSGLNKLMFSELDGFQSFDDFKTFNYKKEVIKLKIPFELPNWFKKVNFFLSLDYKNSSINKLDGILYKYEITDSDGNVIYTAKAKKYKRKTNILVLISSSIMKK